MAVSEFARPVMSQYQCTMFALDRDIDKQDDVIQKQKYGRSYYYGTQVKYNVNLCKFKCHTCAFNIIGSCEQNNLGYMILYYSTL